MMKKKGYKSGGKMKNAKMMRGGGVKKAKMMRNGGSVMPKALMKDKGMSLAAIRKAAKEKGYKIVKE